MKKWFKIVAISVLSAVPALSDVLRVEAGGGVWMQTPKGTIAYQTSTDSGSSTNREDQTQRGYAWLYVKHPVPVLPNVRLEYCNISTDGDVTVTLGSLIPVTTSSSSSFDANEYDAVLYYNLLDNTFWTTLDLGVDIKALDYRYDVAPTNELIAYGGYSKSGTLVLPLVYARARFEIPGTGLGMEGLGSYVSYQKSHVYDARVKADWTMTFVPGIQPGIEAGYRIQKIKIDVDDQAIDGDIDFSGLYVGAFLRF